ncbi:MAG TPA: carboxypeptidase-like regulatory domain-containing protein [Candidatus Limnocylindrales bacterium]
MTQPDTGRGPIESATASLLDWLGRAAGQPARLAEPARSGEEDGLALWPLELRRVRQVRGTGRREPYRFGVRYLVTATGPGGLRLLDLVMAVAVAAGEPEILLEAGDTALWQALGVPVRPALLIDVPAQIAYAETPAPPVLHPLRIEHVARRTLSGTVVGPGAVPLAAIRVEVLGLPHATQTDAHGRFTVAGVPDTGEVRLRLVGRGHILTAEVDLAEPDLVIHCDLPTG